MKRLFAVLIAVCLLLTSYNVYGDSPTVAAPSAILIDAETGKVLYSKNADAKMYPASTTKIMTGMLAAQYGNLDEQVTASPNVVKIERGSSQIYIVPDEVLTMEQLLYALLLESANDSAIAIAEHVGGSIEDFVEMMNAKAKELGAVNTHFVNPHGLHNENHYTTARDLSTLAREAMRNPIFRQIVGTFHYEIPQTNKQDARNYITNTNKMVWTINNKYKYENAIGIKTGYTKEAKNCLVGGASKNGMELISVILGDENGSLYPDSIALLEYGFNNFKKLPLLQKDMIVTTVNIKNGDRKLNLLAAEDYSIVGLDEDLEELQKTKTFNIDESIKAPVKKGDIIGTVSFMVNGKEQKNIQLKAEEDVLSTSLLDKAAEAQKKIKWWHIVVPIVVLFLIWRTIVTYIKMKRRKRGMFLSKRRRY